MINGYGEVGIGTQVGGNLVGACFLNADLAGAEVWIGGFQFTFGLFPREVFLRREARRDTGSEGGRKQKAADLTAHRVSSRVRFHP